MVQSVITDILKSKFNIKIQIKKINFEYFPPAISFKGIKLSHKNEINPFFKSTSLRISLRTFQLFLGEIMLETISAKKPYLDIDLDTFRSKKNALPVNTKSPIQEQIKNLQKLVKINYFSINFKGIYVSKGNFIIKDSATGTNININNVNIDFKSSLFTKDRLIGEIDSASYVLSKKNDTSFSFNNIKFDAGLGSKNLKLYALAFNTFSQPVMIKDAVVKNYLSNPDFDINFLSKIDMTDIFSYYHKAGNYSGTIYLNGSLMGNFNNLLIAGDILTTELILNSFKCGKTELNYELKDKTLSINSLKSEINSGSLLGNMSLSLDDNLTFNGTLETKNTNLEHILDHVGIKGSFVELKISGETKISGQLKSPFFIDLDSDLTYEHLNVFNSSYNNLKKRTVFHLPTGRIKAKYFIKNNFLKINQALIKLKGLPSYAELEALFPFDNSMTIDGNIYNLDLSKIKILDFNLTGKFSSAVIMDGKFSNLSLNLPFNVTSGHFDNIPFDKALGTARWFKDDLTVDALKIEYKRNIFINDIFINFRNGTKYSFDIGIKHFDAETIKDYFKKIPETLRSHLESFKGQLKGTLDYNFDTQPFGNINLSGENLSYTSEITNLNLQLMASIQNQNYIIKAGKIFKGDSHFDFKGSYDSAGDIMTGSIFGDIYSNSFNFFKEQYGISEAYLNIFGEFSGTTKVPELYLKFTLSPFQIFNESMGKTDINISLNNGFLAYGSFFNNKLSFLASESAKAYNLTFNFQKYNFGTILDMYLNNLFKKNLNYNLLLSASGNLSSSKPLNKNLLSDMSGEIILHELSLDTKERQLTNKEPIKMVFSPGNILCPTFNLSNTTKTGQDNISFSLNHAPGNFVFESYGQLHTSIIQPLFEKEHLIIESGNFNFNLNYNSNKTPLFTTSFKLENNKFLLLDSSITLSYISGTLLMHNNQLSINNFSGKFGIGDFQLDGSATFTASPNLNFDLRFKNGQIVYQDKLNTVIDGNFNLIGRQKPYTLTGSAFINRLTYSGNFDWKTMLIRRKVDKFLPSKTIKPLFNFNIALQAKDNFLIDNNFGRITFQNDLMLLGTSDNPLLNGSINSTGGYFYYQKHKFEINSFNLSFADSIKIDPHYNINAQTTIEDKRVTQKSFDSENAPKVKTSTTYQLIDEYNVSFTTSGYLSKLSQNLLTLTASPPLSSISLAHLLTFGRTIPQDEELDAETRKAAIFEIVSGQLQEALERETKKAVKGLTLRIEPQIWENSNSTATAVVIEKNISDQLSLKGSKVLDNKTNDQEFKIEYRISPHMSISSGLEEINSITNETIDIEVKLPFGR